MSHIFAEVVSWLPAWFWVGLLLLQLLQALLVILGVALAMRAAYMDSAGGGRPSDR